MSVPASEIAQWQSDLAAVVCDQPCQLYAPVASTDAYGSAVNTWPSVTATTTCGMREPSAAELTNYDFQIHDKAAYHVDFPIGTTLDHQWRVSVAGQVLEVHIILTPKSYAGLLSTICVQLK